MTAHVTIDALRRATITLDGRVDAFSVPDLRAHVDALLEAHVVEATIDLHRASFLDSAGLAAIVRLLAGVRRRGGTLRLVGAENPSVAPILSLTGFDRIFDLEVSA